MDTEAPRLQPIEPNFVTHARQPSQVSHMSESCLIERSVIQKLVRNEQPAFEPMKFDFSVQLKRANFQNRLIFSCEAVLICMMICVFFVK